MMKKRGEKKEIEEGEVKAAEHSDDDDDDDESYVADEEDGDLENSEDEDDDTLETEQDDNTPETEKKRCFSDNFLDLVKTRCLLCDLEVERELISVHLEKRHQTNIKAYTEKNGTPLILKKVFHKCKLCGKEILFSRCRLTVHLKTTHKLLTKVYTAKYITKNSSKPRAQEFKGSDINGESVFSNDYADESTVVCQICGKEVAHKTLSLHVTHSHKMKFVKYRREHQSTEWKKKIYHECKLCHQILILSAKSLRYHMHSEHKMKLDEYNFKYMLQNQVKFSSELVLEKERGGPGMKKGAQKAPQWCDGTMYKCPFCFHIYYRYFSFRMHLMASHDVKDDRERRAIYQACEIITDDYRCKLCSEIIKRDRMDIEAHLKDKHSTTIRIYSENFESEDNPLSVQEAVKKLLAEGKIRVDPHRFARTVTNYRKSAELAEGKSANFGLVGDRNKLDQSSAPPSDQTPEIVASPSKTSEVLTTIPSHTEPSKTNPEMSASVPESATEPESGTNLSEPELKRSSRKRKRSVDLSTTSSQAPEATIKATKASKSAADQDVSTKRSRKIPRKYSVDIFATTPKTKDTPKGNKAPNTKGIPNTKDATSKTKDAPKAKDDQKTTATTNAKGIQNTKNAPSKTKEAPKAKDTQKAKDAQKAKDTPKTKDAQKAKDTPKAKGTSQQKSKDAPNAKKSSKAKESPHTNETSKCKATSNTKGYLKAKEISKIKGNSRVKNTPNAKGALKETKNKGKDKPQSESEVDTKSVSKQTIKCEAIKKSKPNEETSSDDDMEVVFHEESPKNAAGSSPALYRSPTTSSAKAKFDHQHYQAQKMFVKGGQKMAVSYKTTHKVSPTKKKMGDHKDNTNEDIDVDLKVDDLEENNLGDVDLEESKPNIALISSKGRIRKPKKRSEDDILPGIKRIKQQITSVKVPPKASTTPKTASQPTKVRMDEPATKVNSPAKGMSTKGRRKVTTILVHGSTTTEAEADESQDGSAVPYVPSLYKCPIGKCAWTCTQDGIRQGPAVLHVLRVHGVQPVEMEEKGLLFKPIQ